MVIELALTSKWRPEELFRVLVRDVEFVPEVE